MKLDFDLIRHGGIAGRLTVTAMALLASMNAGGMSFGQDAQHQLLTVKPELRLKDIARPLQDLTPEEQGVVEKTIDLIGRGQNIEALALLTSLNHGERKNATITVVRAYLLLELGDLTGALSNALLAEHTGARDSYRCWFLAQVAFLAGNKPLCRREIKHLETNVDYSPEAQRLKRMLDAATH